MADPVPAPLAMSIGDPAGVGPELIARAWSLRESEDVPVFACVGSAALLQLAARSASIDLPVRRITELSEAAEPFADALPVIDLGDVPYEPGAPSERGARLGLDSLDRAAAIAVSGKAGALVTAPIAKAEMAKVGFNHPGQTEFVAASCGIAPDDAVMMLAGPSLRVVPVTVHVALARVPTLLSAGLIYRRTAIAAQALMRERTRLADGIEAIESFERELSDTVELLALGEAEGDTEIVAEAEEALRRARESDEFGVIERRRTPPV